MSNSRLIEGLKEIKAHGPNPITYQTTPKPVYQSSEYLVPKYGYKQLAFHID